MIEVPKDLTSLLSFFDAKQTHQPLSPTSVMGATASVIAEKSGEDISALVDQLVQYGALDKVSRFQSSLCVVYDLFVGLTKSAA